MSIKRSLFFAAAVIAPLALGGCVVAPGDYYANPGYYDGTYAGPAVYAGPSVYVDGCCYGGHYHGGHGGGYHSGWHGNYHR